MSIAARFALSMTLALALVMAGAGWFLLAKTRDVVDVSVDDAFAAAAEALADAEAAREQGRDPYQQEGSVAHQIGGVKRFDVKILAGRHAGEEGYLYQFDAEHSLLAPKAESEGRDENLVGLFLVVTAAVVLVGAGVATLIAAQVASPLSVLVHDVRAIARGALHHRTKVRGSGEVGHLARAIDKMAHSLQEARETEVELGVREREREVALEVAEALRPADAPGLAGVDVAMDHVAAPEPGGDFYDYQITQDGRLALMVCDVSGVGVPGALVGATARAYLKAALAAEPHLESALCHVNRQVARDVRRGMYVTALVAVLDADQDVLTVACAGHKLPLVRWDAAEGTLRTVQPEGIALGFDRGPIFDRSLALARVPFGPGDRLVLASTGAVRVLDPRGSEFGEKALYRAVAKGSGESPADLLEGLLTQLEVYADEEPYPADISIIALARTP